jgi:hypothetical protein
MKEHAVLKDASRNGSNRRRDGMNSSTGVADRLLLVAAILGAIGAALAAPIDPAPVFQGTMDFLKPGRFRTVRSVYAAPDGSVWVLGVDRGYGTSLGNSGAEGSAWYVRRLSGLGVSLSREVRLPLGPGVRLASTVLPIGILPDGSLVVDIDASRPEHAQYLAKISPEGIVEVTDVLPLHYLGQPFVDQGGVAHLVFAFGTKVDYMQLNMSAHGLPVVRELDYDRPDDSLTPVPGYLRWATGRRFRPTETAFLGEKSGRILVVTPRFHEGGHSFSVYRIDPNTMWLVDSAQIHPDLDVFRSWTGPRIPRTKIVPAGKSGYWFFTPTSDSPPAPTVVAYRIGPDLRVERPAVVDAGVEEPFVSAPEDAVSVIDCPPRPWREHSQGRVLVQLDLRFIAFGSDGRLYVGGLSDSLLSRVAE